MLVETKLRSSIDRLAGILITWLRITVYPLRYA